MNSLVKRSATERLIIAKTLLESVLQDMPTAEPRKGKWITHPGGKFVGFPYMHYECDQCRDFEPEERNYCPNCGADMRGEQNE